MNRNDVTALVFDSLSEIISEKCEQEDIEMHQLHESTRLIGRRSALDSLELVTLIVNIEERLGDEHGISVTIADDRALSMEKSPFKTVSSLSDYIYLLIEEQNQTASSDAG